MISVYFTDRSVIYNSNFRPVYTRKSRDYYNNPVNRFSFSIPNTGVRLTFMWPLHPKILKSIVIYRPVCKIHTSHVIKWKIVPVNLHSCQVSRFHLETQGFRTCLKANSRLPIISRFFAQAPQISRFLKDFSRYSYFAIFFSFTGRTVNNM